MGRYYWDKKDTVEECRSVSISFLRKHDYLSENSCRSGRLFWTNSSGEETGSIRIIVSTFEGEKYVQFYYTVTDRSSGQKTDYDYKVSLTTTPCNFGGVRYWFICPLFTNGVYCGRRVAKLYLALGASCFGCRHCYNLSYESRNESRHGVYGILGGLLNIDKRITELYNQTRRWTYKGRPTKKARKLLALEQIMQQALSVSNMLLRQQEEGKRG